MTDHVAQLERSRHLRRADAALAGWIARAFPAASPEVALAAALAARAVGDGHSALPLDQAATWLAGLEGTDGQPPTLPASVAFRDALAHLPPGLPLVLDAQGRVYLRRYFEYERQLARALTRRAADRDFPPPAPLAQLPGVDPEQQHAMASARAGRLTIVTGGPGTGKTFTVVHLLAALLRDAAARGAAAPRIALAAPTGKAAARLAESVHRQLASLDLPADIAQAMPRDAATLHRLLGLSPWQPGARFDAATPLAADVVVVDEVSMVDLPLMAKLVAAVRTDARLILLGDPNQLAAVEPGKVLGAIVAAADAGHLGDCHVALQRSHRFGPESALGRLAAAISARATDTALAVLAAGGDTSLAPPEQRAALVADAITRYTHVAQADSPAAALAAARAFRVLTALRHGPAGCVALDRAIAAGLAQQLGYAVGAPAWRGRLVMVTANRTELGLFNGDTGVAFPTTDGTLKIWFEGADGAPRGFSPAVLPPHEGAFALTVHKAQGSEFETVALVTGPDSQVLTRELLYTGVTRARRRLTLHADADTLRTAIAREALRFDGLADRLREAATAPTP